MTWRFMLGFLPPNVNHMYVSNKRGGKVLTETARQDRDSIATIAGAYGFVPDPLACYAVKITFLFPTWAHDIDGPIKGLLDAIFGARADQRVVRLSVEKTVLKGHSSTYVEIVRLSDEETALYDAAAGKRMVRAARKKARDAGTG